MKAQLKSWWAFDEGEDASGANDLHAALRPDQRRETLPLLTMAFCWGLLIAGLTLGGSLGNSLPFEDIIKAIFIGNSINFLIGVLWTILGLGIYAKFIFWIDLLAAIAPPIIGPLLVEFYITNKAKFKDQNFDALPKYNPAAFAAYFIGAASTFAAPEWIAKALVGLLVSILAYAVLKPIQNKLRSSKENLT